MGTHQDQFCSGDGGTVHLQNGVAGGAGGPSTRGHAAVRKIRQEEARVREMSDPDLLKLCESANKREHGLPPNELEDELERHLKTLQTTDPKDGGEKMVMACVRVAALIERNRRHPPPPPRLLPQSLRLPVGFCVGAVFSHAASLHRAHMMQDNTSGLCMSVPASGERGHALMPCTHAMHACPVPTPHLVGNAS